MEARLARVALLVAAFFALGAGYRTQNFIVSAPDPSLATEVGQLAEKYRHDLAIEWLGQPLPPWPQPCPLTVTVGPHLGAGGQTSFMFEHGRPFNWQMSIQGTKERALDSVLPHEVSHTIFATHFGRPLPRWADEGACTTVEHLSEKQKQHDLLYQFLTTNRGIAFNQMFAMKDYPRDILPLYAQGFSVARYLIAQGGKRKFVQYVGDGMQTNDWNGATRRHYGLRDLSELQVTWLEWVRQGSPSIAPRVSPPNVEETPRSAVAVASAVTPAPNVLPENVIAAAPSDGWYARARERARTKPASYQREVEAPVQPELHLSRPQPMERPTERILEGLSTSRPDGPTLVPIAPIAPPQRASGTVWR